MMMMWRIGRRRRRRRRRRRKRRRRKRRRRIVIVTVVVLHMLNLLYVPFSLFFSVRALTRFSFFLF